MVIVNHPHGNPLDNDKLSIVLAKEEHLNDIVDVIFSSSQESGRLDNHQFGREALMAYIAFVDETFGNGVCGILAYRKGKPIGYISAMMMPPMPGMNYFVISFIIFFWVLKEERGTQTGRALIEGLRRWSVNRNAKEIHLQVTSAIHPAKTHKMLLSEGFHPYGVNYILHKPFDIISRHETDESIEVIQLTADDDPSIISELVIASVKESIHAGRQFDIDEYMKDTRKALTRDPNRVLFVAKCNDKPIGYAMGNIEKDVAVQTFSSCYISHFYIAPEKSQSVVERMMEHMTAWAKTKDIEEITFFILDTARTVQIGETLKSANFIMIGGNYVLPLSK